MTEGIPKPRIEVVVFDIGNVLVDWDPPRYYDRTIGAERRRRLFAEVDLAAMNRRIDLGHDIADAVAETAARHPGWAEEVRDWHRAWLELIGPELPEQVALLRALRSQGRPVWALTNFGDATFDLAQEHFPVMREFDGAIVSGKIGVTKPCPAIYAALEGATGHSGAQIFFIDDRAENAEAAAGRGWRTHHFRDFEEARRGAGSGRSSARGGGCRAQDGARRMTPRIVPAEAGAELDWLDLAEALARGHDLPRAQLGDTFLYREPDTLLTRSALIDGLGAIVKSATVFPGNAAHGAPTVNGAACLFSDADGTLEALVDFHLLTRWKTAGDSLLAARRLAPPEVRRILVVGAGNVADSLLDAYGAGFPQARFTIWNRSPEPARRLAARREGIEVADDLPAAVAEADIVTCATMATEPVIRGAWLRPGQHVDLIGAYRTDMREADDEALARARLFVDCRETVLDHIGEFYDPLSRGVISPMDVVADFYELDRFVREPGDITLFKNGGGAHLDLMTARYILDAWRG